MLFVCLYNEYDDADDDLLLNQMVIPAQRCAGRHTLSLTHEDGLLINIAAIKRSSEQA